MDKGIPMTADQLGPTVQAFLGMRLLCKFCCNSRVFYCITTVP